ncbi:S8/S53 family peptidase [Lichenicola cladoniae]|uniref:S8/S53 family peptidase n=1 Tax=Lichenicola cladoniae TaxID=1484109 RepID=A0A6M8HSG2_9PROT|nr:S53 family peptidase [Lichenicola cladoniae]NPD65705.1 S8/S53 family peptidase [Acetobacteraceae bacterium]QKE91272.1 S8/S53 family peptidase [Lichenicola cladoniae]
MSFNYKRRLAASVASVLTALTFSLAGATSGQAAATSSAVAVGDILAQTVYLPLRNPQAAEAEAKAMQVPGPAYHKFLSVTDFVKKYAPTSGDVSKVEAVLTQLGYTVVYVYPNRLGIEVTSSAGTAQRALGVSLRRFTMNDRTGMAPTTPLTLPPALKGLVRGIGGLDTMTHPRPLHAISAYGHTITPHAVSGALTGGTPGDYLPADFAAKYGVNPIYQQGINGRGATIGIVTLANFYPSDAYLFWKQIGLNVSQSRITTVSVDGGTSIAPSDAAGEGETDLDVEQSGGLAPGANVRVYVAPNNTNANFINAFEAAASDNIADTVSASWGQPELDFFYNIATKTSGDTFLLDAFHDAFLEMALQGQTVFIAAGDSGSFDTVRGCPAYGTPTATAPVCNAPYAVDHPSSDPLVTSAGGTTLPFSFTTGKGVLISVAQEQAWGWDYIVNEAAAQGKASLEPIANFFSVGAGGGVSSYFGAPWYQQGVGGITKTKPGQTLTQDNGAGPVTQYVLPAKFAGRNSPDISANADPESGYQLIEEGQVVDFFGGTSFVAPQLNGVNALFTQALGRTGQLNPAVYEFSNLTSTDIKTGDNWGYKAKTGYDNAVGNGSLDAYKLAIGLAFLKYVQ